jgi:hypothetical protein
MKTLLAFVIVAGIVASAGRAQAPPEADGMANL